VNQSAQGTDKVNGIINCHLATGQIGRPGTGPFSLTGQPNAMGGREVGGLANMLAAHMGFSPEEVGRVRRFWQAPRMAEREGLKAVALFEAIAEGRVKALWVMATNPAVSLPEADRVRAALKKLDLLIVSENVAANDTVADGAHVLLPAAAWGEKDGTVTNSERRISRQRAFLPAADEAKPDWWIVTEVARRMGFADAFPYATPADIFREHAALSAFENGGSRDFDIGGLMDLSDIDYASLEPVQWPVARIPSPSRGGAGVGGVPLGEPMPKRARPAPKASLSGEPRSGPSHSGFAPPTPAPPREGEGKKRFFAEGGFFTADGRARFVAPERPAAAPLSEAFPFRLNTGRVRDQWHTMTRTGRSARLGSHTPVPFVEINPVDAARFGLFHGDLARVSSRAGSAVLEVVVAEGQRPGSLFAPIHWSGETSSDGRVGALVHPVVDPFSGQPDAKATPAAIEPLSMRRRGFLLARAALPLLGRTWWSRVTIEGGTGTLFATDLPTQDIAAWANALFRGKGELAEYADPLQDIYRCAAFVGEELVGSIFVGPAEARPQWDAAKALFARGSIDGHFRRAALSGQLQEGIGETGPTICACFGVGLTVIRDTIMAGAATSAEQIGIALRAGTNCGSCVPELKRILAHELAAQAG
jgi:assimilatory nitrate reductase catalytic subunit